MISAAFEALEAGAVEFVEVETRVILDRLLAVLSKYEPIDEKIVTLLDMCGYLGFEEQVFSIDFGTTYLELLSNKDKHKVELSKNIAMHDGAPPASVLNPEALIFYPSAVFQSVDKAVRPIVSHSVSATCAGDLSEAAESIRGFWDIFIHSVASFAWDDVNNCQIISAITVPPWLMYRWTNQQIIDAACCPGCLCEVTRARCFSCAYGIKNALFENNLTASVSKPKAEIACINSFVNDFSSSVSKPVAEIDGNNSHEFINAFSPNAWGVVVHNDLLATEGSHSLTADVDDFDYERQASSTTPARR